MDLYIKFIAGLIYAYAMVTLNYSVFRVRVTGKDKQIMILALIFGAINFYFKFVENSSVFLVTQVIVYAIAVCIIRRYPLLYAFAFSVIGIICAGILDVIVTSGVISSNLYTIEQIVNDTLPFVVMHLLLALIYSIVAWGFIKFHWGFSFVVRKFAVVGKLLPSTFIWAILLAVGLGALQFISQNIDLLSHSGLSIMLSSIALVACIIYAYFQNKKSLIDRFGETKKAG